MRPSKLMTRRSAVAQQFLLVLLLLVVLMTHPAQSKTIKSIKPREPDEETKAKLAMSALAEALGEGDVKKIKQAISHGADINAKGSGEQTPLLNSVLRNNAKLVKILLELGADVTIPEKDGYTVMHAAGFQGRVEALKILAKHKDKTTGEKISLLDKHKDGFYPMHRACWGTHPKHAETVQLFLELGVPYDLAADNGKTCMDMTPNEETKIVLKRAIKQQRQQGNAENNSGPKDDL